MNAAFGGPIRPNFVARRQGLNNVSSPSQSNTLLSTPSTVNHPGTTTQDTVSLSGAALTQMYKQCCEKSF